jgi:hypothetical protein
MPRKGEQDPANNLGSHSTNGIHPLFGWMSVRALNVDSRLKDRDILVIITPLFRLAQHVIRGRDRLLGLPPSRLKHLPPHHIARPIVTDQGRILAAGAGAALVTVYPNPGRGARWSPARQQSSTSTSTSGLKGHH